MDNYSKKINAVHERDLANLLEKLGIRERFEKGKVLCKFCGTPVTIENIHSFLRESAMVNMICAKPECINLLADYMDEKKKITLDQG
ncbi:MAG: hypothetical protein UV05_C0052G0004 [candidate division CPR1 bacterium GW2011_GWA2_42_17]|uniref:Uncharacterized protein n=2 Tax=Bacteria candidate phyla TaxID=1783234 RepID=A0A0G1B5M4_9BACT|nr:MAG: hypothetical protein UV05_C0052G0004 [candidate division CPR1 bacterium GW2011_GWA2_42_17]OGZ01236.1 MAG: hypothetical protein A3B13_00895 [Candidatus Liptonbacteria bacterium RIFCSPLOWO2_01_FULL_45_15]